ncbi:hypothetical protein [Streptomyces sp. TRM68367]|uniref:hypothetical protein n=1 Tax=Streptomyces sp. TRM68367 TaxID=2758415 RepID=UPI00165B1F31|nr:hypothetical protein [Streptomyces sp. TRM68367]MBC9725372.1 hypothetical protein [Streptomyces sp. TRM68367]
MDDPTRAAPVFPAKPEHPPGDVRAYDPPAVALGNASLLGVGYLILRRRGLAVGNVAVTVVLVWLLASTASQSYEIAVLVWWAGTVLHGWYLAAGRAANRPGPRARRRQRLVALGVTLPVLLIVGLLRFDAGRAGRDVTEAQDSGNSARVRSAQDRVWSGHRVTDAPPSARGDEAVTPPRSSPNPATTRRSNRP